MSETKDCTIPCRHFRRQMAAEERNFKLREELEAEREKRKALESKLARIGVERTELLVGGGA